MTRRNRRRNAGFTLVELLVVISIIGMLMALLLPAVQSAREAGRANTCRNNQKNLALALISYETQRGAFPGYVNDIDSATNSNANDERSWTFVLLPYLENRSLYDLHKNGANGTTPTPNASITQSLEFCICPSNPPEGLGTGATSYVVNSGQVDITSLSSSRTSRDSAANGIFHYNGPPTSISSGMSSIPETLVSVSSSYISGQDGTVTTLLLSENADAYRWASPEERYTGFTYHHADGAPGTPAISNPSASMGLNVNYGKSKAATPPDTGVGYARPSSYHPSGLNVAFADGHVRFISDTIAYGVYQALMTPRGSRATNNSNGNAWVTDADLTDDHQATRTVDSDAIR